MRRDKKNKKGKKFGNQNRLTLFQKPEMKFGRSCPLSQKNSPIVDYKNIKLLRKYTSDTGKIHKIWSNVRVKDHAKSVVEELKNT